MSEPHVSAEQARALTEWAEHEMTLTPGSTTALRGSAAAEYGAALLAEAQADITATWRTFGEDEIRAEFGVPRGPDAIRDGTHLR